MHKIAICDDDRRYRKTIEQMLWDHGFCRGISVCEYGTGEELIKDIEREHDLIFMDMHMPGMDGIETAKRLRTKNSHGVLVFCTNSQIPTVEAFKVRAFRYIIKDQDDQMLREEMPDIVREMLYRTSIRYVDVSRDGEAYRIPLYSVSYISVAKRGAVIHLCSDCRKREIPCRETVKELYKRLSGSGFVYAHNSYIVNMENIRHLRKNVITMEDETELNISRSRRKDFEQFFSEFFQIKFKRR